jgi:conjugal transfer ATP-binding protein TraC
MFTRLWQTINDHMISVLSDKEESSNAIPPSEARINEFFRHHRLSDLLPYEHYDPDSHLFTNTDSIGFAFELYPTTGADDETARIVSGLFTQGLPDNTSFQFMLYGSDGVTEKLSRWARSRDGGEPKKIRAEDPGAHTVDGRTDQRNNNMYMTLARKRVNYLLSGARKSLASDQPVLVRDYRLVVSVSLPKPSPSRAAFAQKQCEHLRKSILGNLQAAGLPGAVMSADTLVDLLDDILNPRALNEALKRTPKQWDRYQRLRDQVVRPDTQMLVSQNGIKLRNSQVRCYSVRTYPVEWALWAMSDMIGDFYQDALRIPCPFIITANIHLPDQITARNVVKLKSARATQASESPIGRYAPVWKEKKSEWDFVGKKINEGHTLCDVNHQIILFTEADQTAYCENVVKSVFKSKGWEISLDRFVMTQAFLSALPLYLNKQFAKELKKFGRTRTMLTWTAANLLPVLGEWKGHAKPVLQLIGRRGQIQWVNPYDNPQGNFNIAVAAASGAGKSFFVQELALSIRALGGRVWIIDVGRSYESLCKLIGGMYLEFGADSAPNLNPFTNITSWQDEGLPLLKPLMAQMASPSAPLSDIQSSFIEQALKHAWQTKGSHAAITTVAEFLLAHDDSRARDLGTQLYPYTKGGMYENYFEGPSTLNFDNWFVVLELGDLANKKDLQSVVLLILMMQISQAMYHGDRSVIKMAIIDEAWQQMNSGYAGEFIEVGYRVVRKHGGAFVTIVQGINDYYKSETARAALENADWMFLLRQKKESIDQLEKSDRLSMTDHMKKALRSVKTVKKQYSEIMIYGPGGWSIGRLVVDPFSEKLYSTESEEFEAIRAMMKNGKTLVEAIDTLVLDSRR